MSAFCSEEDAGRVIGRKGRNLLAPSYFGSRALGQRVGTSVDVEVVG